MNKEIIKLREELFELERDLSRESQILEGLKPRTSETQKKVSALGFQIAEESQVRTEILRQVALGKKPDSELQAQSSKLLKLKAAIEDATDLHDCIQKTIPQQSHKVQRFEQEVRGAKHKFWFLISTHEAEKFTEALALPLARSWAALVLSGAPQNLGPWLLEKFKGLQFQSESVGRALEAEYLGDKDVKNHIEKEENYG